MRRMSSWAGLLLAGAGLFTMAVADDGAGLAGTLSAPTQFPPGPGQATVQRACGPCHAVTVVTSARKSEAEWDRTIGAMKTRGAHISDDDYDVILDYLIANFGQE
jgi:cytochrome c5